MYVLFFHLPEPVYMTNLDSIAGSPMESGAYLQFPYFSTKTYVMGAQKNHLNEMVL